MDKKEIKEILALKLPEAEEIQWLSSYEEVVTEDGKVPGMLEVVSVIAILVIWIVLIAGLDSFFQMNFLYYLIVAIPLGIYTAYMHVDKEGPLSLHYIVTNRCIAWTDRIPMGFKERIKYDEIKSLELLHPEAKRTTVRFNLKGQAQDSPQYWEFKSVKKEDSEQLYELICNNVQKAQLYTSFENELQKIASQFNLTFYPAASDNKKSKERVALLMSPDNKISIQLRGVFPIEHLFLNINCPNPENNAFEISSETLKKKIDNYNKVKDLLIGNEKLDKKYIFLSDNHTFLKEILTDEVLKILATGFYSKIKSIQFGDQNNLINKTKSKTKKTKSKEDESILDGHLLGKGNDEERENLEIIEEGKESSLKFSLNLSTTSYRMIDIFKTIRIHLLLAKAIQEYYRK